MRVRGVAVPRLRVKGLRLQPSKGSELGHCVLTCVLCNVAPTEVIVAGWEKNARGHRRLLLTAH